MGKLIEEMGLSFDDVYVPNNCVGCSNFKPEDVDLSTRLTKDIRINAALISSPMESVTNDRMAILMAQQGGIGIIHSYLTIEDQVRQVMKVKRYESFIIPVPELYTITPDETVEAVIKIMQEKNVSGIPVVSDNKLVGLMSRRDVESTTNVSLKINEVMTTRMNPRGISDRKLITAGENITREDAERILLSNKIEKLPVVDAYSNLKGLITKKDIKKRKDFPYANRDEHDRLMVGAAINIDGLNRIEPLVKAGIDVLCIDTSQGDSTVVFEMMDTIKSTYEDRLQVIAGNVVTAESTERLIKHKADAIRVGFGPGYGCTSRKVTGVGVPQISAVMDCSKASDKYNVPVISDGGIRESGDISKAIAAGASSVMIGSLFAAAEESPAEEDIIGGRRIKRYRGMGSPGALSKRAGVSRYYLRPKGGNVYEGIENPVEFIGSLAHIFCNLTGGLRSAMFYAGARNIEQLRTSGTIMRVTEATQLREGYQR